MWGQRGIQGSSITRLFCNPATNRTIEHLMAVYSMTGYASAQQSAAHPAAAPEAKGGSASRLGLEIRSVNSRFLDLTFRLSEELRQHEPALREMITARLKRGKVEVRAA